MAATRFQRGATTYVARTDGLEVEIAQDAGMVSIAVLPDSAILATYTKLLTPTGYADLHLVRIEPDGTVTDEIADWLRTKELVASADQFEIIERDALIKVSTVPYQGGLIVLGAGSVIDVTHFDGAPGTSVVIAESYEIDDGGCNAGSGAGLALVLAFAGIRRRLTRPVAARPP